MVAARDNNTRTSCAPLDGVAFFNAPTANTTYWVPASWVNSVPGAAVSAVQTPVLSPTTSLVLTGARVTVGGSAPPIPQAAGTLMKLNSATGALIDVPCAPASFRVVTARNDNTILRCAPLNSVAFFRAPGANITYWLPAAEGGSVPGARVSGVTNPFVSATTSLVLTGTPVAVGGSAPPVSHASGTLMLLDETTGALTDAPMPA